MKDLMIKSKVKLICEKCDLIYTNLALEKIYTWSSFSALLRDRIFTILNIF